MDADLLSYCKALPKVELHAHINGSIDRNTMTKLIQMKRTAQPGWEPVCPDWQMHFDNSDKRTLADAFVMFSLIHEVCDTEEAAYMVTKDVIRNFEADNVKYLELRTTPRAIPGTGMTKRSYLENVIRGISECNSCLDIVVRLLLSIDRRTSLDDAWDTLKLAEEFMNKDGIVVGLDLSGDPAKGDVVDFLPVFRAAKSKGLKLALHLSEVSDRGPETLSLLDLPPDRIGHGTFLHRGPDGPAAVELVRKYHIPIEICPTSNLVTQTASCMEDIHFQFWYNKQHPVVICTDDKGVFSTTLSDEFALVGKAFDLSQKQLYDISYHALEYAFVEDVQCQKLREKWIRL